MRRGGKIGRRKLGPLLRNNREHDARGILVAAVNGVGRRLSRRPRVLEIRTGNADPDSVPGREPISHVFELDLRFVDLSRLHRLWLYMGIPMATEQTAIGYFPRSSVI